MKPEDQKINDRRQWLRDVVRNGALAAIGLVSVVFAIRPGCWRMTSCEQCRALADCKHPKAVLFRSKGDR